MENQNQPNQSDLLGFLIVLLRDLIEVKAASQVNQKILERLAQDLDLDVDSMRKEAEHEAVLAARKALKAAYPKLPEQFFRDCIYNT